MNWVLDRLHIVFDNVLCLVGDNSETNKKIAKDLNIPLIGCASHRLNLAVKLYCRPFDPLIKRINELMSLLKRPKNLNLLKAYTDLQPVKLYEIRWTGAFEMIDRFLQFKDALQDLNVDFEMNNL
jgi:hypothetical protein